MSLSINATSRTYPALLPYEKIMLEILGVDYELSLTFVGSKRARDLNQQYRSKDYTPNVLSFPLAPQIGEIFITPQVAKREAPKFNLSCDGYVGYLFIHGCLHLTGLDHGEQMDVLEKQYLKKFKLRWKWGVPTSKQ